jgi:hypothetical protein
VFECQATVISAIDKESREGTETLHFCERHRRSFELLLTRMARSVTS